MAEMAENEQYVTRLKKPPGSVADQTTGIYSPSDAFLHLNDPYIYELEDIPPLGAHEERTLIDNTDDLHARGRLAEANLRLVLNIAYQFTERGIPLKDLIQVGNIALFHKAPEGYDPEKGAKFASYAYLRIQGELKRVIKEDSHPTHTPSHIYGERAEIERVEGELSQELGRDVSTQEVARACGMEEEKVEAILRALSPSLSLDMLAADEIYETLTNIPDSSEPPAEEPAMDAVFAQQVVGILDNLSERERNIIKSRFGIGDGDPKTRDEIGEELGISGERVRQIETEVLATLRQNKDAEQLNKDRK